MYCAMNKDFHYLKDANLMLYVCFVQFELIQVKWSTEMSSSIDHARGIYLLIDEQHFDEHFYSFF